VIFLLLSSKSCILATRFSLIRFRFTSSDSIRQAYRFSLSASISADEQGLSRKIRGHSWSQRNTRKDDVACIPWCYSLWLGSDDKLLS
jgi:hypothetical protein